VKSEISKLLILVADRFLKALIGLLLGSILVKNLGVDEFGLYTKELLWYGLIETFGSCGLTATMAVFVVGKSSVIAKRMLVHAIIIKSLFSILIYLCFLLFSKTLNNFHGLKLALYTAFTLAVSCWGLSEGFMIGRGQVNRLVFYKTGSLLLFFIVRVLLFQFFGCSIKSAEMIMVFCVEQICTSLLLLKENGLTIKICIESTLYIQEMFHLLCNGLQSWLNICLVLVYMKVGQVWVSIYGDLDQISQFTVALQTVEMSYSLPIIFTTAVTQKLVTIKLMDLHNEYQMTLMRVLGVGGLVSVIITVVLMCFSQMFFKIFYGPDFQTAAKLFSVLILSLPFVTIGSIVNVNIVASGKMSIMIKRSTLAAVLAVLTTPAIFSKFGLVGVAWSVVYVQMCANLLGNIIFDREMLHMQFKSFRQNLTMPLN
jgi:O-antigen/teichoic acid export membrane protein